MRSRRSFRALPVAVLAAGLLFALIGPPASAATGDVVRTIIADRTGTACASTDPDGNHSGIGVGIAFDGANLWFSCSSDNTITKISPADGGQLGIVTVTGTNRIGALAFDGIHNILYGCGDGENVGTIDLATGAFTTLFASQGCYDGLAYDGEDDTLFSSDDVASTVQHYSLAGAELSSTSISGKLGNCGNSGLAVGGTDLFLGNNGCSEIYKATKDLATVDLFIDSTKTGDRRVEDLECDNLTFSSTGQAVIWSVDAYDNIVTAYEIPNGTCFFGGGVLPTTTTTSTTTSTVAPTTVAPTTVVTTPSTAAAAVRVTPVFTG